MMSLAATILSLTHWWTGPAIADNRERERNERLSGLVPTTDPGILCRSDAFLLEHEVLPHLDDLEGMFDEDRAYLLTGAAGCARPQRVLADAPAYHVRHGLELVLKSLDLGTQVALLTDRLPQRPLVTTENGDTVSGPLGPVDIRPS